MPDTDQVQPTTIQRLPDAVAPALALLAGMQLDLFTPMADAELTADELAVRLGVDANRLSRLLYALAATGLLAMVTHWLDENRPASVGARLAGARASLAPSEHGA